MSEDEAFPGRWVQIMPDIYASGVWNKEGVQCSRDSLPIPQALRDRIEAWQEVYNKLDLDEFDGEVVDWNPFGAEGLAIAREVKAVLSDWTVFYFDEAKYYSGVSGESLACEITAEEPKAGKEPSDA
jgi:hypothetical protein